MQALFIGQHAIKDWIKAVSKACFKRAKKERKFLKNKRPKPTTWDIIKSLA
jgi:hypothetical protein